MIEIIELYKSFNGLDVLKGLTLTIEDGKTHVIIGRSGCGKSVLLKHIIGILRPDKGKIIVNNIDITLLPERELDRIRLQFGMVFQGSALFDYLTVEENVGFLLYEYSNLPSQKIKERVKGLLSLVGLKGVEEKFPQELSGGMRKRVAIARALCLNPSILLYDEPTTGVDPIGADMINSLIRELHDKLGVTSVVVTHDLNSAFKIGDYISMLFGGKIVFTGRPSELEKVDDPIVRQFIQGSRTGPIKEADV
ncbi:MAG TPA: ABC transporter ATP-binding protein [Candidatus Omnitrophica bacterium]|nr:MAG: ABC transporter ATP-binding protein [Candidatus Omnitrophota bacterium]RKY34950.1 MAG: ABC transporter ATP-binding protein [Candidatus Omnitrophota bacterium]RKY44523.1 MAG: ABC transporter ATP-binding protein [Candidatus Omnitrophota bacterium]HEC69431.1 ABC transporter ATP-binding protein [Candidatus Omnitrophota bacterium]